MRYRFVRACAKIMCVAWFVQARTVDILRNGLRLPGNP
jgi:hypothetical protein